MLVTLPFVLLLLDYWPLRRNAECGMQSAESGIRSAQGGALLWMKLIWEKLPFFALSAASSLVTVLVQERAMQPLTNLSLGARVGNALVAYARYLGLAFWPANLATPYPHPGHWPLYQVLLAAALLAGLTLAALALCRRLPFIPTGWFWFVGMMVPVIGIVQVGEQSMADRYTYLPLIGVFIVVAWGMGAVAARLRLPRAACGVAAGLVLVACAFRTSQQLPAWQNSESLYRHAVRVTKKNWIAYYNLGSCLDADGRVDEALTNYFKAVELQPHYPDPLNNIGCALANRKQFAEAVPYFEAALRSRPDLISAHENIAAALRELGRLSEAIPHLQFVVKAKPEDTGAWNGLGNALVSEGRYAEAIPCYEASVRAKPDQAAAHYNLGNALAKLRRADEAISQYQLALQQKPNYPEAQHDLAIVLARQGKPEEALPHLREAIRGQPGNAAYRLALGKVLAALRQLDEATQAFTEAVRLAPSNPDAHSALATALAMAGKLDEAIPHYQEALRYRPDNPGTHLNLAKALASQGQTDEAIRHLNEALRLKPDFAEARQALQALEAAKPK
jgi:tetratricopeptide (TPR) repeat protein